MRFTPQFLDELRARLPVSEVVGRRVKLRKAGREWKGLSPFNKEKTPSFFVNDSKAMWFDFSSGKNGNIFDFLMLTEGVSFPEGLFAGSGSPRGAAQDAARYLRACGEIFRGDAVVTQRRAWPRLSCRPRVVVGDAA
jgi:DNA primase